MHRAIPQQVGARVTRPQNGERPAHERCDDHAGHGPCRFCGNLTGQEQTVHRAKLAFDILRHAVSVVAIGNIGQCICRQPRGLHGGVAIANSVGNGKQRGRFRDEQRIGVDAELGSGMRRITVDDVGGGMSLARAGCAISPCETTSGLMLFEFSRALPWVGARCPPVLLS